MEQPSEEEMKLYVMLCGWKHYVWFNMPCWDKGDGYPALTRLEDVYTFEMDCRDNGEEATLEAFYNGYNI
jgi:hypothetical protein